MRDGVSYGRRGLSQHHHKPARLMALPPHDTCNTTTNIFIGIANTNKNKAVHAEELMALCLTARHSQARESPRLLFRGSRHSVSRHAGFYPSVILRRCKMELSED
ncbi:hypothetical protein E2C01_071801 [Portunus trituberculatus]|uniref:Uncharacterized protein n=1 Tax=Portunus trituberculatus TaxID=210409 RepID=A0A5B7I628_PORTR|nr:hypothetical protein [Portunus trituberculatus]